MAKNTKKELPKAFAALIASSIKPVKELKYGTGETELVIKVDPLPSVGRRTEAIEMAASLLFSFEPGIDGYIASLITFARKYAVLICFTDIDFSFDLKDIWALISTTSLYDDVVREAGRKSVTEFLNELNELISAYKGARIHAINIDSVLDRLGGVISGFSEQFKGIDMVKILKGFQGLPKDFKGDDLIKQIIAAAKGGG